MCGEQFLKEIMLDISRLYSSPVFVMNLISKGIAPCSLLEIEMLTEVHTASMIWTHYPDDGGSKHL
jgi:hypothetical protein